MASGITAQNLQKHYLRIIRQWPKEHLRPIQGKEASEKADKEQINALYSLMENRYSKAYPTSENMLTPAFNPTYYENLEAELIAAPNRSFMERLRIRMMKLIRFT